MSNLFIINEQSNEYDLLSFISDSDCGRIREEKSNYYEKEIFNKNYFSNSDKKTREMTNLQKKRGRKKYKENVKEEHTKFFLDNQIAKILVHYHKFLINLANAYLEAKNFYNKKFFPISGAFTKKRDLLTLKGLLNSSLRDILKQQVSEKYINLSHNKELMEYFDSEKFPDEFKEFFDMKYKFIYSEIFLMNNKDICKEIIELILNCKVRDITFPEAQKTIELTSDGKGIRRLAHLAADDGDDVF